MLSSRRIALLAHIFDEFFHHILAYCSKNYQSGPLNLYISLPFLAYKRIMPNQMIQTLCKYLCIGLRQILLRTTQSNTLLEIEESTRQTGYEWNPLHLFALINGGR